MNTSPARQSFRQAVAEVAEKARARLPQAVNGRIESAARLVLLHDVAVQEDGSILVGSASDPLKQYRLVGTACECQDFTRGQAPEGWCQHRIAAGIHKRVGELRPVQGYRDNLETLSPAPETAPPVGPLPEAAASVNVRLTIAGREVQWTLRDHDEARLAVRLDALLARYPVPQPPAQASNQLTPAQHNALAMHRPITQTGWCAVHDVEMKWNEGKAGRKGWHSHRVGDTWCKGK